MSTEDAPQSDEINHLARVLMAAWENAEGKPVNVSYVATFADMARAVLADERRPQVSTRRTDWGVRDDATGHVGMVAAYGRSATEQWLAELTEPSTLMRRERTTYRDDVTEWVEVVVTPPGPTGGEG